MKKIINLMGLAILTLFVSCEKDTEDISFETNYATFELTEGTPYALPLGTPYTEPGVKAMAGDEELEVTTISNNIDETKLGGYSVVYSATNPDGYPATTTRTVGVYSPDAPDTDISGTYVSNMFRTNMTGVVQRSFSGLSVEITKIAPGIFHVSDFLGGYYEQGIGYGSAYAMTGYVALNSDNTLTLLSSHISGWGDSLDYLADATYNPETGIISWKAAYVGSYIFNVTLN